MLEGLAMLGFIVFAGFAFTLGVDLYHTVTKILSYIGTKLVYIIQGGE